MEMNNFKELNGTRKTFRGVEYIATCSCHKGMEPHYRSRKPLVGAESVDKETCDHCGYYVKWEAFEDFLRLLEHYKAGKNIGKGKKRVVKRG